VLLLGEVEKTGPDAPPSDAALELLPCLGVGIGAAEDVADAVETGVLVHAANRRFEVGVEVSDLPHLARSSRRARRR
jgi:hypothetical protein